MLEFSILAVCVTCIFGMIKTSSKKRVKLPIWERENGKQEMEIWLTGFLAKLKRNSTRTQKCRLISSLERMNFERNGNAVVWQHVRFGEEEAEIFRKDKKSLGKFKMTEFQKMILKSDSALKNQLLCRSKINEESGKWEIPAELKTKIISEGGEALIFGESFGILETAVRVQIFDPFLFSNDFGFDSISWKIHFRKDFEKAIDDKKSENEMPKHENVIKNFGNIELFHKADSKKEDCIGWITIMEKGGEDLRKIFKEKKIEIEERKKIAEGILNGWNYLANIGITHYDLKMENILLVDGIPKIIDFGLVWETTGRSGYREMGYARRGSKFRNPAALFAATPGFARQGQFTDGYGYHVLNLYYFLFCDWKSSWTLLYAPIGVNERKKIDEIIKKCNAFSIHKIKEDYDFSIISEITSIIKIPSSSSIFCLDDRNLTKSVAVSSLKQNATKFLNNDLQNVTQHVIDQKNSNLCVPISVATLLRFAMIKDLGFKDKVGAFSTEAILASLTLIIFPRSMAGLNLNPKKEETEFQLNQIELLLERLCKNTYLMESGWEIIRQIDWRGECRPKKSTCKFKKVILNENFQFSRPLTVTGAYLLPDRVIGGDFFPAEVFFHQMVLDRVDDSTNEYVIHNTSFAEGGPVLRISKKNGYYGCDQNAKMDNFGRFMLFGQNGEEWSLVHEIAGNMKPKTWYLLPRAYSIILTPEETRPSVSPPVQQQIPNPVASIPISSERTDPRNASFAPVADPEIDDATQQLINSLLNEDEAFGRTQRKWSKYSYNINIHFILTKLSFSR